MEKGRHIEMAQGGRIGYQEGTHFRWSSYGKIWDTFEMLIVVTGSRRKDWVSIWRRC